MTSFILLYRLAGVKTLAHRFYGADGLVTAQMWAVTNGTEWWAIVPIQVERDSKLLDTYHGLVPSPLMEVAEDRAWSTFTSPIKPNSRLGEVYIVNGEFLDPREDLGMIARVQHSLAKVADCELALVSGNKTKYAFIERREGDPVGMLSLFAKKLGVKTIASGKVAKRASQLIRSYLVHGHLDSSEVSIVLWDDKDATDKDFDEKSKDGAIIVSRDVFDKLVRQSPYLKGRLRDEAYGIPQWNARFLVPAGLIASKPHGCMLKGQVFVSDTLDEGTILTHSCNLKKEIQVARDDMVIVASMSPQEGHDRTTMSSQYLMNQGWLFPLDEVARWFQNTLDQRYTTLVEGKAVDSTRSLLQLLAREDRLDGDGYHTTSRFQLAQWAEAGLPINALPEHLMEVMCKGTDSLCDPSKWHVRASVPYSVHWQVVTDVVAGMLHDEFAQVQEGTIRFMLDRRLVVQDAKTYVANRANHGNEDQDDFFDIPIRMSRTGAPMGVLLRSPNGRGEYEVVRIDGPLPCEWKLEEIPPFPAIPGGKEFLPLKVTDRGEPEKPDAGEDPYKEIKNGWGLECLEMQLRLRVKFKVSPGSYTLARQAMTWCLRLHPTLRDVTPLITEEDSIDLPVQQPTEEGMAFLGRCSAWCFQHLLHAPAIPQVIWDRVGFGAGKALAAQLESKVVANDQLSTFFATCKAAVEKYVKDCETWIATNAVTLESEQHAYVGASKAPDWNKVEQAIRVTCGKFRDFQNEVKLMGFPYTVEGQKGMLFTDLGWDAIRSRQETLKPILEKLGDNWALLVAGWIHLSGKVDARQTPGTRWTAKLVSNRQIWPSFLEQAKEAELALEAAAQQS